MRRIENGVTVRFPLGVYTLVMNQITPIELRPEDYHWYIERLHQYLKWSGAVPVNGRYSREELHAAALKITGELHRDNGGYAEPKAFKYYR